MITSKLTDLHPRNCDKWMKIGTCPFHKWDMITHTKRAMAFNSGRVLQYPRAATHHSPGQKLHNSRSNHHKSIVEGYFWSSEHYLFGSRWHIGIWPKGRDPGGVKVKFENSYFTLFWNNEIYWVLKIVPFADYLSHIISEMLVEMRWSTPF